MIGMKAALVLPMATGMALRQSLKYNSFHDIFLEKQYNFFRKPIFEIFERECFIALQQERPDARSVIWFRIDQKSGGDNMTVIL